MKRMKIIVLGVILSTLATYTLGVAMDQIPVPKALWTWDRYSGNPVITAAKIPVSSGAKYWAIGDPSVMYDSTQGKFKMWFGYGGMEKFPDEHSVRVPTAYAESSDGYTWQIITAPALSAGSGWDRTNAETPCVIKDDNLPDGHPRKYRMYYSGLDTELEKLDFGKTLERGMLYGIGLAFSPDGKNFTRLPARESPYGMEGLVLKPNPPQYDHDTSDFLNVNDPHVLYHNGQYHLWYTSTVHQANATNISYAIAYATSADGIHWEKQGPVIKPDQPWERLKPNEPGVGQPYVIWNNNRFEMFYDTGLPSGNQDLNQAIFGFAWSTDGRTWTKEKGPILTPTNGPGEEKGVLVGPGVLIKNNTYYLYYPAVAKDGSIVTNLATRKVQ